MKILITIALITLSTSVFAKKLTLVNNTEFSLMVESTHEIGGNAHGKIDYSLNANQTLNTTLNDDITNSKFQVLAIENGQIIKVFNCFYNWQEPTPTETAEIMFYGQMGRTFSCIIK